MGNRRREVAVLIAGLVKGAENPYRIKYLVADHAGVVYRVVLHKKRRGPLQAGELVILYQDRHTGSKWGVK